jgi:hypothetical protein
MCNLGLRVMVFDATFNTKREYIPNNLLFWSKILDLPHNKKCHEYEKKLMDVEFVNVQIIYYYLIMLQGL